MACELLMSSGSVCSVGSGVIAALACGPVALGWFASSSAICAFRSPMIRSVVDGLCVAMRCVRVSQYWVLSDCGLRLCGA